MGTTRYFGYGALKSRAVITTVIGRDPGEGKSAILEGVRLTYQVLDQLPESIRPIMERVWGPSFRAYTLKNGSGFVAGMIWELTDADMQKIRNWEFVGQWRESVSGTARTADGEVVPVEITRVSENQPIKEAVDGITYETNLNGHAALRDSTAPDERVRELTDGVRQQLMELAGQGAYGRQLSA